MICTFIPGLAIEKYFLDHNEKPTALILFVWCYTVTMQGVPEFASVINANVIRVNGQCKGQKFKLNKHCYETFLTKAT